MAAVARLTREQVDAYCPRFQDVQTRTDETYARIAREQPFASASQLGTTVHVSMKRQLDGIGDPDYRAEVSAIKSKEEARYGDRGSVRIDVLENVGNGTVCVYDPKTGRAGLSAARIVEIATAARLAYRTSSRIVVTGVRPRLR